MAAAASVCCTRPSVGVGQPVVVAECRRDPQAVHRQLGEGERAPVGSAGASIRQFDLFGGTPQLRARGGADLGEQGIRGLATGSAETRSVFEDSANRRQYLCRAIFQYRSAADGVGENATPIPIKSGRSPSLIVRWISALEPRSTKAQHDPLIVPSIGRRQEAQCDRSRCSGSPARVQVLPMGDPDDTRVLRSFVSAVLAIEPEATGPAVLLFEAGNTVVRAFIEAGIFALAAIALLLWITLRRIADVLLTLVPLLVAIIVTLELSVALDLPLNFANIIALPLLLGVGVAFKIYYIMAWRSGKTTLVQSTLTRAVIFSAMTQAVAFGSLWLSSDPGTSSMGKLMALSLLCTMAAAVLFQPALMGQPRPRAVPAMAAFDVEPQVAMGELRQDTAEQPVEPVGELVDR
jgi:hypothetical protein